MTPSEALATSKKVRNSEPTDPRAEGRDRNSSQNLAEMARDMLILLESPKWIKYDAKSSAIINEKRKNRPGFKENFGILLRAVEGREGNGRGEIKEVRLTHFKMIPKDKMEGLLDFIKNNYAIVSESGRKYFAVPDGMGEFASLAPLEKVEKKDDGQKPVDLLHGFDIKLTYTNGLVEKKKGGAAPS